ncbi:MAG: PAS domain-containing sensor histidine kinase [Gammaproteobacteria bacterium]|nr:PAS domain-containing sensor histidine kinase [Gammaproteobacteria bacterium]
MARESPAGPSDLDSSALLDMLATAIIVIDAGGLVCFLNSAAGDLLAIGTSAARGRRLASLLVDGAQIASLILRSRTSGEPLAMRGFELAPAARSDANYQVDITLTPLAGAVPDAGFLLVEIADTTQPSRITRDTALLAQQGGSRVMARQLAHEIKNPLGGLRGAAQLLERELPNDELKEYTRVIIGEADRLCALVDSLLGPARPIRREPVNVHELIDHVYRLARAEAPAGVAIERDYDPSLPLLALDRDLMVQAMLNLARNAVQALGERGVLTMRSRALTHATIGAERHRVVASLQFEDNGPGVPTELGETIFYPLVTARAGGTGLGLAVAQDIAIRHGGIIEFDSRPGRTVFSLLLPMEESHEQAA